MAETYLVHYGVSGMKWGIRKETPEQRTARKAQAKAMKIERKALIKEGKRATGVLGKMEAKKIKNYYREKSGVPQLLGGTAGGVAGITIAAATTSSAATAGAAFTAVCMGGFVGATAAAVAIGTAYYAKGRREVNDYYMRQGKTERHINKDF